MLHREFIHANANCNIIYSFVYKLINIYIGELHAFSFLIGVYVNMFFYKKLVYHLSLIDNFESLTRAYVNVTVNNCIKMQFAFLSFWFNTSMQNVKKKAKHTLKILQR